MHVSIASETIFALGPVSITNSVVSAFVVGFFIICFAVLAGKGIRYIKPGRFQVFGEMFIGFLYKMAQEILGYEKAKKHFGFVVTLFIFIVTSNLFGLLPFVPSIAIKEDAEASEIHGESVPAEKADDEKGDSVSESPDAVFADELNTLETSEDMKNTENEPADEPEEKAPEVIDFAYCLKTKECYLTTSGIQFFERRVHLFRAPTSDLSFTIALALVSVAVTNILGLRYLKLAYLKKYINFSSPINFAVGIFELISECSKIISFSFRLFGNIFSGELILMIITSLSFGIGTMPFLLMEIFVGVIQGFVFFMLTTVFIKFAISEH